MPARSKEREQFLADIITTALEGGIGYWSCALRYKWSKTNGEALPPAGVHAIIYIEDDEHEEMLQTGLDNFVSNEGRKPTATELLGYGLTEEDQETPLLYKIDIETIAKGIGIIVSNKDFCSSTIRDSIMSGNGENDAGDIDADGADVIVQAALFGKLVFG